jgi:hypothetical protein
MTPIIPVTPAKMMSRVFCGLEGSALVMEVHQASARDRQPFPPPRPSQSHLPVAHRPRHFDRRSHAQPMHQYPHPQMTTQHHPLDGCHRRPPPAGNQLQLEVAAPPRPPSPNTLHSPVLQYPTPSRPRKIPRRMLVLGQP